MKLLMSQQEYDHAINKATNDANRAASESLHTSYQDGKEQGYRQAITGIADFCKHNPHGSVTHMLAVLRTKILSDMGKAQDEPAYECTEATEPEKHEKYTRHSDGSISQSAPFAEPDVHMAYDELREQIRDLEETNSNLEAVISQYRREEAETASELFNCKQLHKRLVTLTKQQAEVILDQQIDASATVIAPRPNDPLADWDNGNG